MNVLWRTLLVVWKARRRLRREGPLAPHAVSRITLTTLLTDLDIVGHMNNGRYLSLFDLGRFDLLTRTGLWAILDANGWYSVIANATISFRKSLRFGQRFQVESKVIAADDRAIYVMHRAVVDEEVYAELLVRARFLRRSGGVVPMSDLFAALGANSEVFPEPEPWVHDWVSASSLPSTKAPAPSVWPDD